LAQVRKTGPTQRQRRLGIGESREKGRKGRKRCREEAGNRNPLGATKSAHDQRNVAATLDKKPSQHLRRRRGGWGEVSAALVGSQVGGMGGAGGGLGINEGEM